MTPWFADTFFFLALLNPNDKVYHERAQSANIDPRAVVTSAWVLLELADHLCNEQNRRLFGDLLDALAADSRYTVIPVDEDTLSRAITMYRSRSDKDWSLTDCTSFVLMEERGIKDALTADRHFEQAGFSALLR